MDCVTFFARKDKKVLSWRIVGDFGLIPLLRAQEYHLRVATRVFTNITI